MGKVLQNTGKLLQTLRRNQPYPRGKEETSSIVYLCKKKTATNGLYIKMNIMFGFYMTRERKALCRFYSLFLCWWNVLPGDPSNTGTMVSSKAKPPVKRETTYTGFLPTRSKRGIHKRKPTISAMLVRKKLRKTSPARLLTFHESPRNTKATTNLSKA